MKFRCLRKQKMIYPQPEDATISAIDADMLLGSVRVSETVALGNGGPGVIGSLRSPLSAHKCF
jgi:hypothetical protein